MKSPDYDLHHRCRRKAATAYRQWLVVPESSPPYYLEEAGKQSIMKLTGLPARDLRVLDPLLSYPSTILGRERAIVVNLEHIRAVVTATEVLIPNSKDPMVASFVCDMECKVSGLNAAEQGGAPPLQAMGSTNTGTEAVSKATTCWPSFTGHHLIGRHGSGAPKQQGRLPHASSGEMPERSSQPPVSARKEGGAKVFPFEFKALEICLESACRCLESETLTLEEEAYPALDELTSKLSALNLERVRQLKSRLVALSGRVQKVRDELEHLLDDDMDMAEMYLSEKLAHEPVDENPSGVDVANDKLNKDEDDVYRDGEIKSEASSSHGSMGGFKPNIEELEMLLEAYFVQIDGTLNKLSHLTEYVDDTEDYINIMLDDKQNQLLQMGVMLSTATMVLTAGVVVVSIFGMNITISIYKDNTPTIKFWETTFGTVAGCAGLYALGILGGKKSGLLQ